MGIPLALIVTPLLYAAVLIGADVVSLVRPVPAAFWDFADKVARTGLASLGILQRQHPTDPTALAAGAAVLLLPGAVLSLGLWLAVNALFRRAGVGGALLALNARDPNPSDLNELRLVDVVQEMAIASGLPPPAVMLVDAPGANAAAVGTSPADARIIVSRRLVDDLSRDELEGVLAHLVASVGNGDLRIAFRVTALFETCGLLVALINSPFGRESRHTLWRILRFGLGGSSQDDRAAEAAAVADILARNVVMATDDIDRLFDVAGRKSRMRSIRNFLLFPIFFTNVAIQLSLWFFSSAVLGPSVALLWRTRRYLADASAVQMTRNPDGLAGALKKLNDDRGAIPNGGWAAHLFIVSPSQSDQTASDGPTVQQKGTDDASSGMSSLLVGFHPSLNRRLKRLDRMGAHVDLTAPDSKAWVVGLVFGIVFAPLFLLLVAMFLFLIAVMTLTSLVFLVLWLAFIHKIFALVAQ